MKDQIHQELTVEAVAKNSCDLSAALADIAEGQISYNKSKSAKYHAIEKVSEYISWLGFAIAFLCAVWLLCSEFHWIPHQSWLIFNTAFIPALVSGIHGINGFLNIGGLADEHFKIASVLDGMRNELELMPSDDIHGIHDLAERAYGQLVGRDTQWEEGAKKVNLKPARNGRLGSAFAT